MKDLPVYKITIDSEYGDGEDLKIDMIAFTKKPAIKVKGMAFADEEVKKLSFKDDVKQRIVAPYMIPMQIYRSDVEEYMVEFTVEEIDALHSKFMKTLAQGNGQVFNDEHNSSKIVPAYVLQVWKVEDTFKDIAYTKYGIEVPVGTMMLMTQVVDKDMYEYLVKEDMLGYSIEGFLGLKLSEIKKDLESCGAKSCGCGGTNVEMAGGMPRYRKRDLPPFHDNCRCRFVDDKIVANADACDYCRERIKKLNINMSENKNKETEMEENKALLPGEYPVGENKILVVKEDGTCEIIEKKVDAELEADPKPEDKKEEVVPTDKKEEETKLEADPKAEDVEKKDTELETDPNAPAAPVEPTVSYTKEEIDAKFEELYKAIADLKVEEEADKAEEKDAEPTMMSIHDRFSEFVRFSRQGK